MNLIIFRLADNRLSDKTGKEFEQLLQENNTILFLEYVVLFLFFFELELKTVFFFLGFQQIKFVQRS